MKTTVYLEDFRAAFNRAGRGDQFSYEGLELIYDYLDEYERDSGKEIELDVIALCCEWSESTPAEIIEQYDTDIDTEGKDEDEIAAAVFEWLNDETIVAGTTSAGNLVYVQF
jgi:predicted ArsR family transcriptional regulator